mmetsp:Transcript_33920/g.41590  ORF Transcript_33920/g.41590 Transcript_33920/m.41590 type:complete len:93 (+) Transcript_33920:531-809(+)
MEDYELVSLFRTRAALLGEDELKMFTEGTAFCSPRRWQKFGVLYVTFMNSKFVNLYAGGMAADDLYRVYYGRMPPVRKWAVSFWEAELDCCI